MRLRFGGFEFDRDTGELWEDGTATRLQPQPARVLAMLVTRPGELFTREALQQHVWGEETVVDFEQGLNWCIRRLRESLHDSPSDSKFIQTVPRRGYRFVAEVTELAPIALTSIRPPGWNRSITVVAASVVLLVGMLFGVTFTHGQQNVTVLVLPFDNLSVVKGGPAYEDVASAELIKWIGPPQPCSFERN